MTRNAAGPPEEFVAFIAHRAPGLRTAAHALTGNDRLAEGLVDDLLGAVAGRWRWFAFTRRRFGREDAPGRYLDRLYSRELLNWQHPQYDEDGERIRVRLRSWRGPELTDRAVAELAGQVWERGGGLRRRRLLVAAGVIGVILVGLCAAPRPQPPDEVTPPPLPSALPPLMDALPAFADQLRLPTRSTALPTMLTFDRQRSAGLLSANPVRRALAISQTVGSAPMVLGEDGLVRQMDQGLVEDVWPTPRQPIPPLTSASLSPDGSRAAFVGYDVVTVVDLAAAKAHPYPALSLSTAAVWLDAQTLLVSGPPGSLLLDVRTGTTSPSVLEAQHILTFRGPAPPPAAAGPPAAGPTPTGSPVGAGIPTGLDDRVVALLPVGEPATAPARVRRYRDGVATDATVTGAQLSWLGPWLNPGFAYGGAEPRAVRDCAVTGLLLPAKYGRAEAVTVVVNAATGALQRALVGPADSTNDGGGPLAIGWLDRDTALIRTGDGSSAHVLAWRVTDGELRLAAVISRDSLLSVSDVTAPS